MDERQLKDILSGVEAPESDENARKAAVNLARAAFDNHQKEKEKKSSQGFGLWDRLMGSSGHTDRRTPMNKRMIYGGMATAMAVVLVCAVSVQQFQTGSYKERISTDGNNFANIAQNITTSNAPEISGRREAASPSANEKIATAMKDASGERNQLSESATGEKKGVAGVPESAAQAQAPAMPAKESYAPGRGDAPRAEMDALAKSKLAVASQEMGRIAAGNAPVMPMSLPADVIYDPGYYKDTGRDNFEDFEENPVKTVSAEPVSTFSIDVDTSSYSFMRRQINSGVLPEKDSVRVEEMINYFDYDYAGPKDKAEPFASTVTVTPSPWKDGNKLIHIGIKGYDIDRDAQPRSNLVFLLDTSGSMNSPDKLPLVVQSMKLLLDTLKPDDTVALVVYAGSAGTVLEPTKVSERAKILQALDNLHAGGSTAGAEGIKQAYQLAESNFDKEAVNRVILATDGDFNVGIIDPEELKGFVERKRQSGVFLSVLGFGQGNLNDHMMQELAQNGNGTAAYIDNLNEARKVLVEEATSTLFPIAKDVKIQVEFNPATVAEYRLVGYETRHLNREDFNNDAVDAGDIGAGHTVTAIYEITPAGGPVSVDPSRYAAEEKVEKTTAQADFGGEYAFLKIRYKLPDSDTSKLITTPVSTQETTLSGEAQWAVTVAGFGQLLKGGKYTGPLSYDDVISSAQAAKGPDEFGYRSEFIQLVRLAKSAAALQ